MRALAFVVIFCVSVSARAADIGGTLTGNFVNLDMYGIPQVSFSMNLTCALSCTSAAAGPHYGLGTIDAYFASEPATGLCINKLNDFAYDIDPTGSAMLVANPPAGARFFAKAMGVTCWCGGSLARGQGGYIDTPTGVIVTAPYIQVPKTGTVGSDLIGVVSAALRGAETITFTVSGAGLSSTQTFTAADFVSTTSCPTAKAKTLDLVPTAAGTLTLTAVMDQGGVPSTVTVDVTGSSSGTGGSVGSTGGGSGSSGGGDGSNPSGCSAAPAIVLAWGLLALLGRRR